MIGSIIVLVVLLLVAGNAVCTLSRQKKRMKGWTCQGDCKTCKIPCQAKRIYNIDEANDKK